MANRSWPPLDSLVALNSFSGRGLYSSEGRSRVFSILNSSAGTRKTNWPPLSSRSSAKIRRLFHSPSPAEELAKDSVGLPLVDRVWKMGKGLPDGGGASDFLHQ